MINKILAAFLIAGSLLFGCQETIPRPIDQNILLIANDSKVENFQRKVVQIYTNVGCGSGIVIAKKANQSYILTCHHVIERAMGVLVGQKEYINNVEVAESVHRVKIIGFDKDRDLALLRVDSNLSATKVSELEVKKLPSVGSEIYTVGFPEGGALFFSIGNIAKYRYNDSDVLTIETTAPISKGNSGGGVFSKNGKLIGNTSKVYIYNFSMTTGTTSLEMRDWLKEIKMAWILE